MFKAKPDITRGYILARIAQEDILERYLGIRVQFDKQVRNPLRQDKDPTCCFWWFGDRLKFRDWSKQKAWDCFDIVQIKYGCSYGHALNIVAADFDLLDADKEWEPVVLPPIEERESSLSIIEIERQPFTSTDSRYLNSYGLSPDICQYFMVTGIRLLSINGIIRYQYSSYDPAIGYYFGKKEGVQQWKSYFYRRRKGSSRGPKFLGNTKAMNGLYQILKYDVKEETCVITKSMKDVMVLRSLGITAVAPQSEVVLISPRIYDTLSERFKRIYSLYDHDETGVKTANLMKREYDIPPKFIIDTNPNVKDISDHRLVYGYDATIELLKQLEIL